jgi:hypothetical protein
VWKKLKYVLHAVVLAGLILGLAPLPVAQATGVVNGVTTAITNVVSPFHVYNSPYAPNFRVSWTASKQTGTPAAFVLLWARKKGEVNWVCVANSATAYPANLVSASGTFTAADLNPNWATGIWPFQGIVEFAITWDTDDCTGAPTPPVNEQAQGIYDEVTPIGYVASGPLKLDGSTLRLACNAMVLFGVARDPQGFPDIGQPPVDWAGFGPPPTAIQFRFFGTFSGSFEGTLGEAGPLMTAGTATVKREVNFRIPPEVLDPSDPPVTVTLGITGTIVDLARNRLPKEPFVPLHTLNDEEKGDCRRFSDVPDGAWFSPYVRYLASAGLFSGFEGMFRPNDPIIRAELAVVLERSLGKALADMPSAPPSLQCNFSDVTAADWFARWVWGACNDGLMVGFPDGRFRPNDPVTRAQAAVAIWAMRTKNGGYVDRSVVRNEAALGRQLLGDEPFTDVVPANWFFDAVNHMYNIGLVAGKPGNIFDPDGRVTRAELATMVYKALGHWQDGAVCFGTPGGPVGPC